MNTSPQPAAVFCDWLTTSHPLDVAPLVRSGLQSYLDAFGFTQEFSDAETTLHRAGHHSTVRQYTRHGVHIVAMSGKSCSYLRSFDAWGDVLGVLGSVPHRVTMLHATMDVAEHGPTAVAAVLERARLGVISFTRKSIPAQAVRAFMGTDIRGEVTGTAYIGAKHADVQGVVYDKRHERENAGEWLDAPLTRYELRLRSGVGITLHDAYDPTEVFWHHAGRSLLTRPDGVQPWVPRAEGFTMPPRMIFTPAELMDRKLDASADVARLLELAAECGPHGIDLLCSRLKHRHSVRSHAPGQPQAAEAPRAVPSGVH